MKHVVFDLGAVLFTWRPRAMLMRVLPTLVPDEAAAAHWEREVFQDYGGDWGEFDRGTVDVSQLVERISLRTGMRPHDVAAVVRMVPKELQPIPESVALLHRLGDAGHTLHYLSNMPAPYADILERNDFFARFSSGVFSARVHHNKPEPGIFAAAEQLFGVPPADLVFLDDHAPNVRAAEARGWHAIQFLHAEQAAQDLRARGWAAA